jgi:DNA-binding GntR family transcriptional regulator
MLLRDNVHENLRSDILTCGLAPGDDMHVALIEALQRCDARGAVRLIKAHVLQTKKRVLPALKRNVVIS